KTHNVATSVVSLGLVIDSGFPWSCKSNSRGARSISSALIPTKTVAQDPVIGYCWLRKAGTRRTPRPMIYPKYSGKCGQTICRKNALKSSSKRDQTPTNGNAPADMPAAAT
ncbi:hypothetical protein GQ607_017129, partial [Colletotrichum asianum]